MNSKSFRVFLVVALLFTISGCSTLPANLQDGFDPTSEAEIVAAAKYTIEAGWWLHAVVDTIFLTSCATGLLPVSICTSWDTVSSASRHSLELVQLALDNYDTLKNEFNLAALSRAVHDASSLILKLQKLFKEPDAISSMV